MPLRSVITHAPGEKHGSWSGGFSPTKSSKSKDGEDAPEAPGREAPQPDPQPGS